MDEELKKILNNPKVLYSLAALVMFVFIIACADIYSSIENKPIEYKIELEENNYKTLVDLNQAPNSQAREPDEGDIDTGVTGMVNGIPARLYASRTWANDDYGKTFLWKDN